MKASRTMLLLWLPAFLAGPALTEAQSYNWTDPTQPSTLEHALVFDSARGVSVLFGGYFTDFIDGIYTQRTYGNTCEWNGTT